MADIGGRLCPSMDADDDDDDDKVNWKVRVNDTLKAAK